MAFFGMFRTRRERDEDLRLRVRQGTLRIQKFISRLNRQAEEYRSLARRAFDLDDQQQFRQLASGFLQCCETINRWERYIVRLRSLELRKQESEATQEFLSSMNALTTAILDGVRPEDVAGLTSQMEAALQRSEDLEEALADAMDEAVTRVEGLEQQSPQVLLQAITGAERLETDLPDTESRDRVFQKAMESERQRLRTDGRESVIAAR